MKSNRLHQRVPALPHSLVIKFRGFVMRSCATVLIGFAALMPHRPAIAIVGGQALPPTSGSMVMVLSDRGSVCSAVVIAPDAVLTAAHCVTGASAYRLHWRDGNGKPVLEEPRRIVVHPDYHADAISTRSRSIDLAIIQSRQALPSAFVPAMLPDARQPPSPKDSLLTVMGFGIASETKLDSEGTLREIRLPVITPYGQGKILIWLEGKNGQGTCTGDSGGGMFDKDDHLHAITVWTEVTRTSVGQSHCGKVTQGVLVAPHRAWIDKTLKR